MTLYNKTKLLHKSSTDNATIIKVNNIDLVNATDDDFKRDFHVIFNCNCGEINRKKSIRYCIDMGLFCKKCSGENSCDPNNCDILALRCKQTGWNFMMTVPEQLEIFSDGYQKTKQFFNKLIFDDIVFKLLRNVLAQSILSSYILYFLK